MGMNSADHQHQENQLPERIEDHEARIRRLEAESGFRLADAGGAGFEQVRGQRGETPAAVEVISQHTFVLKVFIGNWRVKIRGWRQRH
jgi:hypothetical protein